DVVICWSTVHPVVVHEVDLPHVLTHRETCQMVHPRRLIRPCAHQSGLGTTLRYQYQDHAVDVRTPATKHQAASLLPGSSTTASTSVTRCADQSDDLGVGGRSFFQKIQTPIRRRARCLVVL